jgi:hypothetical protein
VESSAPGGLFLEAAGAALQLVVGCSWDGLPLDDSERVTLRLSGFDEFLLLEIDAPFHDDPPPPGPAASTPGLWDYEVVELFLCGPGQQYTEIEVGPHGHYLVLRLDGVRKPVEQGLALSVETAITGARWRGRVMVPRALLPAGPHRVAAYAIHGTGPGRRFCAAFPVPGESPDFHRLDAFASVVLP